MVQSDTTGSTEISASSTRVQISHRQKCRKTKNTREPWQLTSVTVRAGPPWVTAGRGGLLTGLIEGRLGSMNKDDGRTKPRKSGDRSQEEECLSQCPSPGGEKRKSHKSHHP